jgi:lipoprotein-releasing system ATP-binding protein
MSNSPFAIETQALSRAFRMGDSIVPVLQEVDLQVPRGQFASIIGSSGSGKSTLLHLIGLLDRLNKGKILINGTDIATQSAGKKNRMRSELIGFVFQFYHLLPELDVLENVMLPAMVDSSILGWPGRARAKRKRATELLGQLDMSHRIHHKANRLSGGERQRVAIARALMNEPEILLADEPTGNLDTHTGEQIMDVLLSLHRQTGQTILMVTHDTALARRADRTLHLRDGKLTDV